RPSGLLMCAFQRVAERRMVDGLVFLLLNAGPGLRRVVSSRADPLLLLHRYRLAGELAEIRAGDLAFSVEEAGEMLAQHGCTLSAGSAECLTRQTEGWAAGPRPAAMSLAARPDPHPYGQEVVTRQSALTGYLVEEVLNTQPAEVREVLLGTSILDHVNADIAGELVGNGQAGRILADLAQSNAFVQPVDGVWYRYHTLFAEMLRLKLELEHPDRIASLHRQAARWYERNRRVAHPVRHAPEARDLQPAAGLGTGGRANTEIHAPRGAGGWGGRAGGRAGQHARPCLFSAALALSAGGLEPAAAALDTAEQFFERLPADQEDAARLAAAMIRHAVSRHSGDLTAAAE